MKILFVNPASPDNFWSLRYARDLGGYRSYLPSLALPTLAAMVPVGIEVEIRDENVEEIDLDAAADLVCITGCDLQAEGVIRLARGFRARGRQVVVGGPYASLSPAFCRPHADVVVVGEAERIFPRFLDDFLGGRCQARYEEHEAVDLRTSPVPRWDLMRLKDYGRIPLQTTREGAEINLPGRAIGYAGSKFRAKPAAQVLDELDALVPHLQRAGHGTVFLADEDFAVNPLHARELCRALAGYNQRLRRPLRFDAQVTAALAEDGRLLERMAEAGFASVVLHLESGTGGASDEPRREPGDLVERIRKIQAVGLFVWAGFEPEVRGSDEGPGALERAGVPVASRDAAGVVPADFYSYASYGRRLSSSLAAIERRRPLRPELPGLAQLRRRLGQLARLLRFYLLTDDRERRRFFSRIVVHTLRHRPGYLREALWHVALHKHFHRLATRAERGAAPADVSADASSPARPMHQAA